MKIIFTGCRLCTFLLLLLSVLMIRSSIIMITTHIKCRGGLYPRSNIERFPVPDEKVSWSSEYREYQPHNYTSPCIHGKPWADPNIGDPDFNPQWNSVDGNVSRLSHMSQYKIENGYPLNPIGRTGISGRGILGRWGPNHAADPVVTRWKRLENGEIEKDTSRNKPILQFVAVKRRDTGEWALPGGMVDPGEKLSATAAREFQEEAINSLVMSEGGTGKELMEGINRILGEAFAQQWDDQKKDWLQRFEKFFNEGDEVYKGYIDDPRNTDNAWMESVAYNFHDNNGSTVGALKLHAGDDAVGVRWVDITPDIVLYASHKDIVMAVFEKHQISNLSQ